MQPSKRLNLLHRRVMPLPLSSSQCILQAVSEVRAAAMKVLAAIAKTGDLGAIKIISGLLGHGSEDVRVTVAKCFESLAKRGEPAAIIGVSQWLEDDEPAVRKTAVKALGGLVDKQVAADVALVTARLRDEDVSVRVAAVHAMKQIFAQTQLVITNRGAKIKAQVRPTLGPETLADFGATLSDDSLPDVVCMAEHGDPLSLAMLLESPKDFRTEEVAEIVDNAGVSSLCVGLA